MFVSQRHSFLSARGLLASVALLPAIAAAQTNPEDWEDKQEIIVTAPSLAGSVAIPIPADVVLDAGAIQSYGVSSVADLLTALSAQTRSGRGRGAGRPVVLLNGKRISGFAELRDFPTEAIQRVEILPEDAALRFGYAADQRVINFILKPGFNAVTLEAELGAPTQGRRTDQEFEAGLVRIGDKGRINLDAEYTRYGAILEKERGISAAQPDQTAYRTVAPSLRALKLNSVINRTLGGGVDATLSVQHDQSDTQSLLGLRPDVGGSDAIKRDVKVRTLSAGLSLDGRAAGFGWTATGSAERTTTTNLTDPSGITATSRDAARARLASGAASLSATGPLMSLPAGPATINLTIGVDVKDIESRAVRAGIASSGDLGRDEYLARVNLDLPLTSRRRAVASMLGDISLNLNGSYRDLSDFGGLESFGYGVNWSPLSGVTLLASRVREGIAPTPAQLGDPLLTTPNALVFDYGRGETALVSLTTGGNIGLQQETRRDTKFGLTYEPKWFEGLTVTANYFRNRTTDPIAAFPALLPAIAAAFPERVTRDAEGALVALDQRALNFLASRSDQLRWGLSMQRQIAASGPPAARGAASASFGSFGRGQGGRWSLSVYHTLKFSDEIDLALGGPRLDLLNGAAIGQTGGTPRHMLEVEGGWFNRGIGVRLNGTHQTASSVQTTNREGDLRFSDLTTLNLRLFLNFDQKRALVAAAPVLKGVRLALRVDNLFNDVQKVRDATGQTPLRYQRGYMDPVGRRVEVSLRKIF